jgi:serine/threonine protein kinase
LKPENVLLDHEGHVKLTDFGLSKQLEDPDATASTFCGTSEYLAPEVLAGHAYSSRIDWWALGILCFELLYGKTPFANPNRAKLYQAIRTEQPTFSRNTDPETERFIRSLLEKNPDQRADFERIKEDPFFMRLDFDEVLAKKIKPEFVPPSPEIEGGNFDRLFTSERPHDSTATPIPTAREAFEGFSFATIRQPGADEPSSESDGDGIERRIPTSM